MTKRQSQAADNFTRGLELIKQQTKTQLRSAFGFVLLLLAAWVGFWVIYVLALSSFTELDATIKWAISAFSVDVLGSTKGIVSVTTSGGVQRWPATAVVVHPWFINAKTLVLGRFLDGLFASFGATVALAGLAYYSIIRRGRSAHEDEIVRGPKAVDGKELARMVRKKRMQSRLMIGDVPLIQESETEHLLIMGSTGVGKTQAILRLMKEVERAGHAAICYDRTGGMIEKFYDPSRGDVILNALDQRSPAWSPWAEMRSIPDAERLAQAFIPAGQGDGQFFNDAARALLAALFVRVGRQEDRSVLNLLRTALVLKKADKRALLRGTEAAKYFEQDTEAGHDVDMIMSTYTRSLRFLPLTAGGPDDFSIRGFVDNLDRFRGRKPWLFLAAAPEHMAALRPLMTCWVDAVASAIQAQGERRDRRIFVLLDEWQTLQEVPTLPDLLAEGRKYGAAIIAGNQNIKQVEEHYGKVRAPTMLSLFNTKAVFRVPEPESAEWCEDQLGKSVWERPQESIRFATSSVMDGIQLQMQRQQEAIVLAAEIVNLPKLTCYIQLPGPWPVGRTVLPDPRRTTPRKRAEALVPRPFDDTIYAELERLGLALPETEAMAPDPERGRNQLAPAPAAAAFEGAAPGASTSSAEAESGTQDPNAFVPPRIRRG